MLHLEKYSMDNSLKQDVSLRTENGDITLQIPESPEFMLKAKAHGFGVNIISDFKLEIVKKDNRKVIASFNDEGKGYQVNLSTTNGNIFIKKGDK